MNGIILINKPQDYTSHDVVNIIRRVTGIKKVGHTGTLDPMATGVLPICIGRATKIADYVQSDTKEYIAGVKFGIQTDTYDITGKVLNTSENIPSSVEVEKALKNFKGEILQEPPMYSALKYNGKKLYQLAREGITVERKKRLVTIYDIELLEQLTENSYSFIVRCSSGTYVRSICNDLGLKLNTFATMNSLERTKVGKYNVEECLDLEQVKTMSREEVEGKLLSIETALEKYEKLVIPSSFYNKLLNGVPFIVKDEYLGKENIKRVYSMNKFIGLGLIVKKDEKYILKFRNLVV